MVVCWQDERLASWLPYYLSADDNFRSKSRTREIIENTTGAQFFGEDSKMFRLWHPDENIKDRDFLLVSPKPGPLQYPRVVSKATPTGDIQNVLAHINGKSGDRYFFRYFREGSEGLAGGSSSISNGGGLYVENYHR